MGIPFNPAQSLADVQTIGPNTWDSTTKVGKEVIPPNPLRLYLWVFWPDPLTPVTLMPDTPEGNAGVSNTGQTGMLIIHNASGPGMVQKGWYQIGPVGGIVTWYEGVRRQVTEE